MGEFTCTVRDTQTKLDSVSPIDQVGQAATVLHNYLIKSQQIAVVTPNAVI